MSLKNAALDQVRVNVKNDQTYTMTAALPFATLGNAVLQGYTTTPGDGGKATFTSNITTGTNFTLAVAVSPAFVDLKFTNTGASGANFVFLTTTVASDVFFQRCIFNGGRGDGFAHNSTSGNAFLIECEAYNNNLSNTANEAGFRQAAGAGGVMFCYRCYSHDNSSGVNAHGFENNAAVGAMILIECISDTNGGNGLFMNASHGTISINSNYYNNTGDAIKISTGTSVWTFLENNNFIKNGGKGVNNTITSQGGILYNNGRGSGTQANGAVDVLQCIVDTATDITYASNVTPWNAPTTGDFSTILAAAKGVGRGAFTETDGTNTGTIGYPDIGAAQAIVPAPSGGLRLAGSGGLAA